MAGATGSTELAGTVGLTGATGAAGPQGAIGATGSQGPLATAAISWSPYRDFTFRTNSNRIQEADSAKAGEIAGYAKANPSGRIAIDGADATRVVVVRDALIVAGVPADRIQSGAMGDPQLRRDGRVGVLVSN
jgi:outer membrane protein OmpA-like peptidoglycan-associated protein